MDGEDCVLNEPMQWVVTVYKNGKEIEKKSLVFREMCIRDSHWRTICRTGILSSLS